MKLKIILQFQSYINKSVYNIKTFLLVSAAAAAAASGAGYMSPYYALPGGGVQAPLLPPLSYPPQLQEARMQ